MARLWEIRESYGDRKMSEYDCGYEDGYAAAMEEVNMMGERSSSYRIRDTYTGKDTGEYGERMVRGGYGRRGKM